MSQGARRLLEGCFRAALARVEGGAVVSRALSGEGAGLRIAGRALPAAAPIRLIAAGKAAVPMARAFAARAGSRLVEGLVVTRDGHGGPVGALTLREAAHPVPDARSAAAGGEALALAARTGPEEVLVVLLSGGASALLARPAPGITLADLRATTDVLLRAGAPIEALNAVRKHLTSVSAGQLAAATRAARVEALALSDVPGDDVAVIASGPCAPDPSTFADARAAVRSLGVEDALPAAVRERLHEGCAGRLPETPKPGDARLARASTRVLASNRDALLGAADEARRRGCEARIVSQRLRGEARVAGRRLAALAAATFPRADLVLLAGGETTVTVRGAGRGGRSQELALAAALGLRETSGIALLAAGTDGSDGPTDAAGAFADGETVARGRRVGASAEDALARNDAYAFFSGEGGLLRTGPTATNVMDLVLVLRSGGG